MGQLGERSNADAIEDLNRIIKTQGEELLRYQCYSAVETDERLLLLEMKTAKLAKSSEEYKASRDYWIRRCVMLDEMMKSVMKEQGSPKVNALSLQIKDLQDSIQQLEHYIELHKISKDADLKF